MTYDELEDVVQRYFADQSRPAPETRADLLSLAAHCEMLAETLPED